jgi:hypothetical protein
MDIQWAWKENNGEILKDQGFERLPTILNLEERIWNKESSCFIDLQEEQK